MLVWKSLVWKTSIPRSWSVKSLSVKSLSVKRSLSIRSVAAAFVLGLVLMVSSGLAAQAAGPQPFDSKAFASAQAAGKPILVEIHASWCPTCKAQAPILAKLEGQDKFRNLVVFRVDYDSQKEAVRAFGARMQSTLIAFKGKHEVGRSVGDTNETSIAALLGKAI